MHTLDIVLPRFLSDFRPFPDPVMDIPGQESEFSGKKERVFKQNSLENTRWT
jgi:hypothetical protein